MIVFPNAKLNLGLQVKARRDDGYHEMASVLIPIALTDVLEIVPTRGSTYLINTGIDIETESSDNLCMKAWELLKAKYDIPSVMMHLHKCIPTAAGLGGGSSDAAFTITALNTLFKMGMSETEMEWFAAELGSDCPFFIKNRTSLASGRGEKLKPIRLKINNLKLCIVKPGVGMNTKSAYSKIRIAEHHTDLELLVSKPVREWKGALLNDFEEVVFEAHPNVAKIKELLYGQGALYAAMSGSGTAVFGFFEDEVPIGLEAKFSDSFYWKEDS